MTSLWKETRTAAETCVTTVPEQALAEQCTGVTALSFRSQLSYARFAALVRLNHNDPHCLHLCQTFDATGNGDIDIRECVSEPL